ncbi:hypothetical protein AGMMS49959_00840 [Planctomycetales bacterium]|nr:hypothetical protein AGMMS49959_00840 [Planctomycetales bacterium]
MVCFTVLAVVLLAKFPGYMSDDTVGQWGQAHSLVFDDVHPVIHTLAMYVLSRLVDHYAFVVLGQIIAFSLAVGYLMATLEAWGIGKKTLVFIGAIIILNPYTINIMMVVWKDVAFTILLTYAVAMTINIYLSHGRWLEKNTHIGLFALTVGLASLVRHNGILFTLPLLSLLLLVYADKRFKLVTLVLAAVALILAVMSPPAGLILTFAATMFVYLYSSGGTWGKSVKYIGGFAVALALTYGVHREIGIVNFILFALPLSLIVLGLYASRSRRIVVTVLLVIVVILTVKLPLYKALKVPSAHMFYQIACCLPMVIMGDVMVKNPQALPPDVKKWLNTFGTDEEWQATYIPGMYASIEYRKFGVIHKLSSVEPRQMLRMTWDTIKSDPHNSLIAVRDATAHVWALPGKVFAFRTPWSANIDIEADSGYYQMLLYIAITAYDVFILGITPLGDIFVKTGWQMLAILLGGALACHRYGVKALMLVLPTVCYNIGTMPFSEGPGIDVRFHHFNAVISLPLLLILFAKLPPANETASR